MSCGLVNTVVGAFNASILVDSQYGRSKAARNLFYVLPDETIYNFEAYARKDFSPLFLIISNKKTAIINEQKIQNILFY